MIYFGGIAGVGLDGEANRRAGRMPGWLLRHGGYALAALRALVSYVPPTLRLYSYDGAGKRCGWWARRWWPPSATLRSMATA